MSQQVPKTTYRNCIQQLKDVKLKITNSRQELLMIMLSLKKPFTAENVVELVSARQSHIHRATVYRDLLTFVEKGLLTEIVIQGTSARYFEFSSSTHHHHFVCQNCFKIIDVIAPEVEDSLMKYEQHLAGKDLSISHHQLKFYGLCSSCKKLTSKA